jgi:alanine racemase
MENAIKYNIAVSIFNDEHIEMANQLYERLNKKLKVHIKLDTGMNRIGINKSEAKNFIKKVTNSQAIELEGIFTHFADVENEILFEKQINEFREIIEPYKNSNIKIHCLNSPGMFSYPQYSYDMVRMGIIMWGLTPYSCPNCNMPQVKPVMGLKARITNIHTLKENDGISYGHTYIAQKDTKVATIPIGYADGIARNLSGKITAILNGKEIKQIGRITMDQIMFNVDNIDCSVGDVITLLGEENKIDTIDTWAKKLDTINYELTCRLKMRLPRIYVR